MAKPKEIDIIEELRVHIARKYKTQAKAAEAWNVSAAMVSGVMTGVKPPTESMLEDAGFRRVKAPAIYERV